MLRMAALFPAIMCLKITLVYEQDKSVITTLILKISMFFLFSLHIGVIWWFVFMPLKPS